MEERLKELLKQALKLNASDIHFNLYNQQLVIELRIGKNIKKIRTKKNDDKLLAYLQYLANFDVSNQIKPQTGQFEMEVNHTHLSIRFAYMQTYSNISGVLRILNHKLKLDLATLSAFSKQNNYFQKLVKEDNGLILISGATGSGKTTTLYTFLKALSMKKVFTIEDPIEIYFQEFVQLQINQQIGLNYQAALKQLLRHDPDVIVIGEIRDQSTADVAIRAAMTGHLVLATIHASSALATIYRLQEYEVSEILIKELLISIINQELVITKQQKRAIYEIISKKDLDYYFKNQRLPRTFHNKNYYLQKALATSV